MKHEARDLSPEVCQEFRERWERMQDDFEDAACEAEALRCLECGFKRPRHASDCEDGRARPRQILVSGALVHEKRSHGGAGG